MFCPKCGSQVPDGTRFCPSCGAKLSAAAPTPGAPATGPATTPVAGGGALPLARVVRLVAAAAMIVSFFLPLAGMSVLGHDFSFSAFQGAFGMEFMGSHFEGDLEFALFVIPGIAALLSALLAKAKVGDILAIVCGAAIVVLLWLNMSEANDMLGGYVDIDMLVGGWLYLISGIASIAGGVMGLVTDK